MTRYRDIPQFTRDGSYAVDQPLDQLEHTLSRYEEIGLDLNADFQRGHVWVSPQQIKYVEFLLRGGQSSRLLYFNCVGWMDDYKGPFVLVDGKQRLTAVLRFLRNEIPVFGHLRSEFEGHFPSLVSLRFNINTLKTRAEVLQWYLDLNEGGVVHSQFELDRVRELLAAEKS